MNVEHVLPEIFLVAGAVVILLAAMFLPRERLGGCALLALAALGLAAASAGWLHARAPQTLSFSGTWALDGITAWTRYAIFGATALVAGLSPRWFRSDGRHGEWYVMLLLSALGATMLAAAADLMELLVGALLSSVTGYVMASYHRASPTSAEAGARFYFLGALSNAFLLMGIILLYGLAGSTRYGILAEVLPGADPLALGAGLTLFFVGLSFKLGAFPVHPWVPDVAQGSPAPAAAFLTVVPKIAALVALVRLLSLVPDDSIPWPPILALAAAVTMTIGNLAALWQTDLRRLLGWSSVSQIGYGLLAVVTAGPSALARPGLLLFITGYALANLLAFAVVVSLRGRSELADYQGLARARPGHALALTLALLSLVGIPPLIGFSAKLALFGAAIEAGYAWLALLGVLNTVISVFYYLRVIGPMYLGHRRKPVAVLAWPSRAVVVVALVGLLVASGAAQVIMAGASSAALLPAG